MKKEVGKRLEICCALTVFVLLGIAALIKGFYVDAENNGIPLGEIRTINDSLTENRGGVARG